MPESLDRILSFRDGAGSLTLASIVLTLLATYVLSQIVAWVYLWTHRGLSYSASLTQSLVVLAVVVALVMLVIGSNIARAFGLFGALALIRFRTPVKDARDTVFLFLAVAIGISAGTGNILAGAVGTAVGCLILLFLAANRFGTRLSYDGLVRLTLPPGDGAESRLRSILRRYCDTYRLVHIRETEGGGDTEHSYQVRLVDPRYGSLLAAEIQTIEAVKGLSLLFADSEGTP